jgi:hypothetical protein
MLQCITVESEYISIIQIVPEQALKRMGEVTVYIRLFFMSKLASYPSHVIEGERDHLVRRIGSFVFAWSVLGAVEMINLLLIPRIESRPV